MHIRVRRGLDLPIKGKPSGDIQTLPMPKTVAIDLDQFEEIKFKLLVKVGDILKSGQPVLFDKDHNERVFISPATGTVKEIRRGLKRRLLSIVIETAQEDEYYEHPSIDLSNTSRDELNKALLASGMFAHIRMRPFNRLAIPTHTPKSIFVKAIESAPFVPPAEMQVEGHKEFFQYGLSALSKLTDGPVHLVYHKDSPCRAFTEAEDVELHTASGVHPVANHSVHIHHIDPVRRIDDTVWTTTAYDVVCIGKMLKTGRPHHERVISIAGTGILPERRGYFRIHSGYPLEALLADRCEQGNARLISGNPLVGRKAEITDYLGANHFAFSVLPEPKKRTFLHFLRPGFGKFSAHKAYVAGHLPTRPYDMTTSLHGEERAFIDGRIYDRVMPMRIPTMPLVKAVIGQDWDAAEYLGLLEVDAEDFALATVICPSKVEMCQIMKDGLHTFASEVL